MEDHDTKAHLLSHLRDENAAYCLKQLQPSLIDPSQALPSLVENVAYCLRYRSHHPRVAQARQQQLFLWQMIFLQ